MTMQGVYPKLAPFVGTTTAQVQTDGGALVGVIIPASMAGTTLQVEMSNDDGVTWNPVFDSTGARVQTTIGATARYVLFPQNTLVFGADAVRLVSSAAEDTRSAIMMFQKVA